MSNSVQTAEVRKVSQSAVQPKAIIHKKILDAAGQEPNATINELATQVKGASSDLVEHVLDEYGDPAENQSAPGTSANESDPNTDEPLPHSHVTGGAEDATQEVTDDVTGDVTDGSAEADGDSSEKVDDIPENDGAQEQLIPDFEDLTNKQKETIHAILEDPQATQKELAERFDVTSATICQRVNDISGFDWKKGGNSQRK